MRIKVDAPEAVPERYWSLKAGAKLGAEDGVEQLRAELETATRQHLVSDVPLGVFLSGGVDSSAIASLAVRAAEGKVKTFNISFEEAKFDESGFARQIADWLGTEHVELRLTQDHFRGGLEDALESLDQPTFDAINSYFVSRLVREAGVTVALAGTGGDELFGGYRSFRDLPRGQRIARVTGQAPSAVIGSLSRLFAGSSGVPPQTRWGKLADLFNTRGESVNMYQVAYGLYTRDFLHELAADSLVDRAAVRARPGAREGARRARGSGEPARGHRHAGARALHRRAPAARHRRREHGGVARGARAAARSQGRRGRAAAARRRALRAARQEGSS